MRVGKRGACLGRWGIGRGGGVQMGGRGRRIGGVREEAEEGKEVAAG